MRILHVAPRQTARTFPRDSVVQALAAAQARLNGGMVQLVAAAPVSSQRSEGELEERLFALDRPGWLGRARALRRHLLNRPTEVVHAHCIGQRALHYARLAAERHGAPLVISPAGLLGLGAGERLRLRCAWQRLVVHAQALEYAAGWHATSAEEAAAIQAAGFPQPICIAPPGVAAPAAVELAEARAWWRERLPALGDHPVALCGPTARSSAAQRALALWAECATGDWRLLIVAENSRQAGRLARLAARLGIADRVLVAPPGEKPPHAVATVLLALGASRCPIRPVAEALAAGLPVLALDELPWTRLENDQAGWCVPQARLRPAVERLLAMAPEVLSALGRNARELASREFDWSRSAGQLLAFYRNLRT